jgi:hypothetical protein
MSHCLQEGDSAPGPAHVQGMLGLEVLTIFW